MRRAALYVVPVLFLALNGCGGGGGGGSAGKGGGSGGKGGSGGGSNGGKGGSSGGKGGSSGGGSGSGGAAGTTAGSGGATGGSGGATGGAGGATGGAGGATGGTGGATGGAGGSAAGSGGRGGAGGSGGAGVGGIGGAASGGIGGAASGGNGGTPAACGDSTEPSSGLTCNTLVATGPCVVETTASGSPPAATGGQIVAGTYDLVSRTAYNTPDGGNGTGNTRRGTIIISGSGNDFTVQISEESGTSFRHQSGTATVNGTMLMFTQTCPIDDAGDDSGTIGYDADTTTFKIHDQGDSGVQRVNVYTKR